MKNYSSLLDEVIKEHNEIDQSDFNSRVLVVDALNTYIRCFVAVPTMNDDGDHVGGLTGFLKSVGAAIRMFKPTRCILVFDGRGGSQRRRKLYPDYKENRKTRTRLNRTYDFKSLDEEEKAMKNQLLTLGHFLRHLPVTVLAPDHVEADDVIAYVANVLSERGSKTIVVSTDKDFLQLVNENIEVYNPIKKKLFDVDSVLDQYHIHPNNFAIYRAIDGDKSDNIPGIRGWGSKNLVKKFPMLSNSAKITINDIIDASKKEKSKLFERIVNDKDTLIRNYDLMQLNISNMSGSTRMSILEKIDGVGYEYDKVELTNLLTQMKVIGVFGNYDRWLLTTFAPLSRFQSLQPK